MGRADSAGILTAGSSLQARPSPSSPKPALTTLSPEHSPSQLTAFPSALTTESLIASPADLSCAPSHSHYLTLFHVGWVLSLLLIHSFFNAGAKSLVPTALESPQSTGHVGDTLHRCLSKQMSKGHFWAQLCSWPALTQPPACGDQHFLQAPAACWPPIWGSLSRWPDDKAMDSLLSQGQPSGKRQSQE